MSFVLHLTKKDMETILKEKTVMIPKSGDPLAFMLCLEFIAMHGHRVNRVQIEEHDILTDEPHICVTFINYHDDTAEEAEELTEQLHSYITNNL